MSPQAMDDIPDVYYAKLSSESNFGVTFMKKTQSKSLALSLIAIGAVTLIQSANATLSWSSPLTSSSPNLVGIAYGVTGSGQGSDPFKFEVAQDLLNLSANQDVFMNVSSTSTEFVTFGTDYNGIVNTSSFSSGGAGNSVGAGWDYAIAKYDGQNAGYILFYLGGQDANLPQYPANFWTSNTQQYGISGWTAFNVCRPVPEPSTVVAGALLLIPLGVQTLRRLRK
jgi:hypothetical protein